MKNPWFILPLLILYLSLNSQPSFGVDTISVNQSLSGDQTIVSSGGNFQLGFFKPGKSSNNYIGIWYGKVSVLTPVWVANRETPIHDRFSAELRISDGNLVLFNESQVPIWSTNVSPSTSSRSVVAVLEDIGNLVLRDGPNSSTPLWQSFDYPTHTFLPGGKLSLNKRTNRSQMLTSWKNSEDPSPGLYSLELDPAGTNSYLILWNRSETYWSSGVWDEKRMIFSLIPEMRLNYIYNFSFVSNENESYFTYSLYNPAILSRAILDVSGQIKQVSWLESRQQWNLFWAQPRQQCEVYAFCGAFGTCNENGFPFCNCLPGFQPKSQDDWDLTDYSGGCQRKTKLPCEDPTLPNIKEDNFLKLPNMVLPQHYQSKTVGSNSECESTCLNDCSCTAYAYDSDGCKIWIGDLLDLQQLAVDDTNGKTVFIRLAASEFSSSSSNIHKGLIIGAVVGSVGLLLVLLMETPKVTGGSLVAFKYTDLQNATKNFSQTLGGGGFESDDGKVRFFPTWAAGLVSQDGDVLSLLDPKLKGDAPVEEVSRICKLACWCIQDDETHRPSMRQVVQILERVLDVNLPPIPNSLKCLSNSQSTYSFFVESSSSHSS
ncbi:S-locus glycoprotein [Corchorus olitorius]|uniref:S-locus glycoprotein n=1 Tax=Corchorus olitorius TaxID=93759 RepID=A0A1R3KU57_9ROSI|nr:S-locus glycoprotein [Corchorus olitorius]